ncbi:MAG: toll/interleukin-1 receptor domain-containing protein [Roseimicrobium sp.]
MATPSEKLEAAHIVCSMAGTNLFYESTSTLKTASAGEGKPCIFISHRKADLEKARQVGGYLKQLELNIYLDEQDEYLQAAERSGNHAKVVEYIERGLARSTHFLGIITKNTQGSWWVPYELGMAQGAKLICAHLIESEVKDLPSFIKVATILPDVPALKSWLPRAGMTKEGSFDWVVEGLFRTLAAAPGFIAANGPVTDLKFYNESG